MPLTLLTKGGASRTIVTGIFNELQENGLQRLLPVTNLLAGLVFSENKANLEWLEREYQKMMDILKDSPAYHWMTDDARNEGLEQGREEAREDAMRIANEAILSRFRMAVLAVIEGRFPKLTRFAKKQISDVDDTDLLQRLLVSVSVAGNAVDAKQCLLDIDEEESVVQ